MYWLFAPVALFATVTLGLVFMSWRRAAVGLADGRLKPCPDSPNCVCSQSHDAEHALQPFAWSGDAEATWTRLRSVVNARPDATIVTDSADYMHAEFTTSLLRFVDDVEFLLDRPAGVIHVRSASRVGRSDLGANRRRIEELRAAFQALE